MRCPHCAVSIHESWREFGAEQDVEGFWVVELMTCPECKRLIFLVEKYHNRSRGYCEASYLARPKNSTRATLSSHVPDPYASDYKEACSILDDSPKASAALSRRCLQSLLRNEAKVIAGSLDSEIQQIINAGSLPATLRDSIDAVRAIGNFAAHPIKSTSTGEIVEVEPEESEWLLDVLDSLFEYYFVQPSVLEKKRQVLNQKLADAGKPPLKGGESNDTFHEEGT